MIILIKEKIIVRTQSKEHTKKLKELGFMPIFETKCANCMVKPIQADYTHYTAYDYFRNEVKHDN